MSQHLSAAGWRGRSPLPSPHELWRNGGHHAVEVVPPVAALPREASSMSCDCGMEVKPSALGVAASPFAIFSHRRYMLRTIVWLGDAALAAPSRWCGCRSSGSLALVKRPALCPDDSWPRSAAGPDVSTSPMVDGREGLRPWMGASKVRHSTVVDGEVQGVAPSAAERRRTRCDSRWRKGRRDDRRLLPATIGMCLVAWAV
ncbi:unnamed protein product [Urochloa humidicola]